MTHRLATNYAKNYCNRTPIVKVIVENVVTCFLGGDTVYIQVGTRQVLVYESQETTECYCSLWTVAEIVVSRCPYSSCLYANKVCTSNMLGHQQ